MKNIKNTLLLFTTILFSIIAYSQNKNTVIKTPTGYSAVYKSEELHFTLRIEGTAIQKPEWVANHVLNLIDDHLKLSVLTTKEIVNYNKKWSTTEKLFGFKKLKTDDINKKFTKDIQRSKFIKDTFDFGQDKLNYNAWYYSVKIKGSETFCYFFDLLNDENLFRLEISFIPNLEIPREMAEVIFSNLMVYDNPSKIKRI